MRRTVAALTALLLVVGVLAQQPAQATVDPDHGWDYQVLSLDNPGLVPLRGGFVGDQGTDIFWYGPGSRFDTLWGSTPGKRGGASFQRHPMTVSGVYTPVVGDFAGDWHTDILWYGPGTASDSLWVATGDIADPFDPVPLRINGRFAPSSLFDGYGEPDREGKDDILWYADGSAADYLWHFDDAGSGAFTSKPLVLNRTFRPVVGDWNGDFLADLLLYAPGTGSDPQWLFRPDGSYAASTGPRLDAPDYQAVKISQPDFDSLLLWRSGPGSDAFFEGTTRGLTQRWLRQGGWDGVAWDGFMGALIVEPSKGDLWFSAPAGPGDFYELAALDQDVSAGTVPVVGDFDSDRYVDVLWYGSGELKDRLWYGDSGAAGAEALGDRADASYGRAPG